MTKDEAIKILANEWAGCSDATGLLSALEHIGAVKFDPPKREELLKQADWWTRPGAYVEVTPASMADATRLICEMAKELKRSQHPSYRRPVKPDGDWMA